MCYIYSSIYLSFYIITTITGIMHTVYSRGEVFSSSTKISHCNANGKTYPLGRPFFFNDGCFRYNCQCKTDGSWECPADLSLYICQKHSGQIIENGKFECLFNQLMCKEYIYIYIYIYGRRDCLRFA